MQITVAKNAGFCFGVKNAVEIAKINAEGGLFVLGDIIHNKRVVLSLEQSGVKKINDISGIKRGDKVLIRAHGVSPDIQNELTRIGAVIFDATCPFVKKVQEIAKEYYEKGYKIIIVGDKNHPEVRGVNGYTDGNAQIIDDCDGVNLEISDKFAVVVQTTFSSEKYLKIVDYIQNNILYNLKTVVFFNTICYTTKARQEEAERLASESDAVLVLGDHDSSNAGRLFEIAAKHCKNTFFVENVSDLPSDMLTKYNKTAILAAASTSDELIEEVLSSMSETQVNEVLADEVCEDTAVEAVAEEVKANEVEAATVAAPEAEEIKAVAEVVEDEAVKANTPDTMDSLMATDKSAGFTTYKEGKRFNNGKVISADENGIFVEIGGKKDGFVDKTEVSIDGTYNPADFKPGDRIETVVISNKGNNTYVSLSKREIDIVRKNNEEALAAIEGSEFTIEPPLKIVKNKAGNPAGLEGRIGGYTVFIPASQIRIGRVYNLEEYADKKLRLRKLEIDDRRHVTASQRVILEEEKAEREEAFWSTVVPGALVKGKVKRFAAFGAFVSVKGYDCLAHVSDLSWRKVEKPEDVLELNQSYDFVVLKADRESGKISLGYKQLQKKPYEVAAEKYPVGTIVKGTIARIHSFGAFVQIEDGIDGLIHVSQISHKYVKEASELLHEGQEVEAKVISFEGNRITLSMKELEAETEDTAPQSKASQTDFEAEASGEAKPQKAPRARARKIEYNPDRGSDERRPRREDKSDEPHEWVSGSGNATLADLLKGIDFKFEGSEEEEK